jgi:hypothetical protein
VAAARQVGLDTVLDGVDAGLGQGGRLGLQGDTRLDIGERVTAPEAEGLRERRRRRSGIAATELLSPPVDQVGETMGVDIGGCDGQPIPRGDELEQGAGAGAVQQVAYGVHPDLEGPVGLLGRQRRPQFVGEAVGTDHAAVVDDEGRQQRPLLRC